MNHEFTATDLRLKLRTVEFFFSSWKFEMYPSSSKSIKPGEKHIWRWTEVENKWTPWNQCGILARKKGQFHSE